MGPVRILLIGPAHSIASVHPSSLCVALKLDFRCMGCLNAMCLWPRLVDF